MLSSTKRKGGGEESYGVVNGTIVMQFILCRDLKTIAEQKGKIICRKRKMHILAKHSLGPGPLSDNLTLSLLVQQIGSNNSCETHLCFSQVGS